MKLVSERQSRRCHPPAPTSVSAPILGIEFRALSLESCLQSQRLLLSKIAGPTHSEWGVSLVCPNKGGYLPHGKTPLNYLRFVQKTRTWWFVLGTSKGLKRMSQ
jgi:hypothetical protein